MISKLVIFYRMEDRIALKLNIIKDYLKISWPMLSYVIQCVFEESTHRQLGLFESLPSLFRLASSPQYDYSV
jgi:hypothetical protein